MHLNSNPTFSIRQVVVPEHSCAFGRLHLQVALVTIPSGVQKINVILYERLTHKTLKLTICSTSGSEPHGQLSDLIQA